MSIVEKIYNASPVFLQNKLCSLYGAIESKSRYSPEFHSLLSEYIESDFASKQDVYTSKKVKLSEVLIAAKQTNYYSKLIQSSNLDIEKDPFHVLQKMPILTKECLISNYDGLSKDAPDALQIKTSGTTGKSLTMIKDRLSKAAQWAIWFRHRSRFGVKLLDLSVNFIGKPVVPFSQKKPPFWRFNKSQNQYYIGMQHVNDKNIKSIVDFLNSIEPVFYSGYPSIISEVSRLALDNKLTLLSKNRPKVIFTGAEKLLDDQLAYIEEWTHAVVTDQYGLTEGNCNFSRCEKGNYHEDYEFCHIELADEETMPDGSKKGRLIGTAFYNELTPLVRYDTGDIATLMPESYLCPCGRNSRVVAHVDGRVDDFVLTTDGRRIMRFDYLFKGTDDVLEAQIIQEQTDQVIVLSVKRKSFDQERYEGIIRQQFLKFISDDMELKFEYTDTIPKTINGKFKAVVNKLK